MRAGIAASATGRRFSRSPLIERGQHRRVEREPLARCRAELEPLARDRRRAGGGGVLARRRPARRRRLVERRRARSALASRAPRGMIATAPCADRELAGLLDAGRAARSRGRSADRSAGARSSPGRAAARAAAQDARAARVALAVQARVDQPREAYVVVGGDACSRTSRDGERRRHRRDTQHRQRRRAEPRRRTSSGEPAGRRLSRCS